MKYEKQAMVPRLRFPEFREAGEWRETQLGELGKFTGGGTPSKSNDSFWQGSIPWVSSSDISEDLIHEIRISRFITEEALNNSATKLVPEGSILLVSRVGVGKLAITKAAVCTSQDFTNLTPCNDDLEFLGYLLKANTHALEGLGQGMAIKGFTKEDVSKLTVYLPKSEEQQKIAGCLSSLDALIAAQADKIDTLKSHKKGLMQQLFPREGETVPRLRFPEFRGVGEWRKCKLEEMARRGSGHTPNKKNPSYYNGGIKWVSLADSDKLDNGYIFKTKHEISKEGLKNSSAVLHPAGTVVLSRDAGVGKSAVLHSPMAVSQHFIAWRCNESELNNWFFYYLLQKLKPDLESIAVGNTIKTIGLPYFKSMEIMAPSLNEQEAIAYCLSSLEALIAANTEKLDALKTHKKGLMQQLFPNPEAVS